MKIIFAKVFEKLPVYWQLATLRCCLYAGIVGWGAFMAGTEGYDTLSQLTGLQLFKLVGGVCATIGGVWLAFLDQSINKITGQKPIADDKVETVATKIIATDSPKV